MATDVNKDLTFKANDLIFNLTHSWPNPTETAKATKHTTDNKITVAMTNSLFTHVCCVLSNINIIISNINNNNFIALSLKM